MKYSEVGKAVMAAQPCEQITETSCPPVLRCEICLLGNAALPDPVLQLDFMKRHFSCFSDLPHLPQAVNLEAEQVINFTELK